METERQEVYERIPWETLERQGGDRQWLIIAVVGAIAVGALAYSFMRNQPVAPTLPAAAEAPAPATPVISLPPATAPTIASPMVVSEADLYAVDPERLLDSVTAHAEWFAVEYFSVDGSDESRTTLASLLPTGVPMPEAPAGTQVFVDWVGVISANATTPLTYEVVVLVRSLVSHQEGVFVRQPARKATVEIRIGPDGLARVAGAPAVSVMAAPSPHQLALLAVPPQVIEQFSPFGDVIGGVQVADGRWQVVVMLEGPDGVKRPTSMMSS